MKLRTKITAIAALVIVSEQISERIIEKKEF